MPNQQKNRGQHPQDAQLFAPKCLPALRAATADLSWLIGKGYSLKSALKLVGDRYQLENRQRLPVQRCVAPDAAVAHRKAREVPTGAVTGQNLAIDGFNLLISVEAALSGAYLFRARDGCLRDIASIHGTYRRVAQTGRAIDLIGEVLAELKPVSVLWYLDQPVSNSGRLKTVLREKAEAAGWPWHIELVYNPDKVIAERDAIAVSSDSWVIDHAKHWCNLLRYVLEQKIPDVTVLDLGAGELPIAVE